MKKREQKYRQRSNPNFTADLASALHMTPAVADEWLGALLVGYAERRHAATTAVHQHAPANESAAPTLHAAPGERAAA